MEAELAQLETSLADPHIYHRWEELHERFEAIGGYQQRSRYEAVLKGLRFEGREQEKTSVLSGGETRRLALGALLLSGSDALLLDEPTNHLDLEMVAWLVNFLQSFGGGYRYGLARPGLPEPARYPHLARLQRAVCRLPSPAQRISGTL